MPVLLLIGTDKGIFLAESEDYRKWEVSAPQFPGCSAYAVGFQPATTGPRLLADITSTHFGPSVATSDDLGTSWYEPEHAPIAFPDDTGASLARVWQLTATESVIYAGTEPAALFRSDDGGERFELVRGLWDHPHRPEWGAGAGGQAVHSIAPHPRDPRRIMVAISSGGVYRTTDGGASWRPANTGIQATFLPERFPEFGQCVHKIARDAGDPDRVYLQNHHGVYRSDDDGATWHSIASGLPADFGFPVVAHPTRPGVVYVFPLHSESDRTPAGHRFRIFRSPDAGETWSALDSGLPADPYYPVVLRDAFCHDGADGLFIGSKAGDVFASGDAGDTWHPVAAHLPTVLCVKALWL